MALHKFITDEDITVAMRAIFVTEITDGNSELIKRCEATAIKMIRSKMSDRYDMDALFSGIRVWDRVTDFVETDIRSYKGILYKVLVDNQDKAPDLNTTEWEEFKLSYPTLKTWSSTENNTKGQFRYASGKFYKAIADSLNKPPATEPTYWTLDDPRNELIVKLVTDMTIYFLLDRISPRKRPEISEENYKKAMSWLDGVKKQMENPDDIPQIYDTLDSIVWDQSSNNKYRF